MMENKKTVFEMLRRPELYQASSHPFWVDCYISQSMFKAHLNPDSDGASRRYGFIDHSAQWIGSLAAPVGGGFWNVVRLIYRITPKLLKAIIEVKQRMHSAI